VKGKEGREGRGRKSIYSAAEPIEEKRLPYSFRGRREGKEKLHPPLQGRKWASIPHSRGGWKGLLSSFSRKRGPPLFQLPWRHKEKGGNGTFQTFHQRKRFKGILISPMLYGREEGKRGGTTYFSGIKKNNFSLPPPR